MLIAGNPTDQAEVAINHLETTYDFTYPVSYREFLLRYNGGMTCCTKYRDKKIDTDIREFHRIEDYHKACCFMEDLEDGVMEIAANSFGDYFYIGLNEKRYGKVYFRYHDRPKRYIKVADDFYSFIQACESERIGEIATVEQRKERVTAGGRRRKPDSKSIDGWKKEIRDLEDCKKRETEVILPKETDRDQKQFLSKEKLNEINKRIRRWNDFQYWLGELLRSGYISNDCLRFEVIKDKKKDSKWFVALKTDNSNGKKNDDSTTQLLKKRLIWNEIDDTDSVIIEVTRAIKEYLTDGDYAYILSGAFKIAVACGDDIGNVVYEREQTKDLVRAIKTLSITLTKEEYITFCMYTHKLLNSYQSSFVKDIKERIAVRRLNRLCEVGKGAYNECSDITFFEDTVAEHGERLCREVAYKQIRRLATYDGYLYLFTDEENALIIPDKVFGNERDKRQLIKWLEVKTGRSI